LNITDYNDIYQIMDMEYHRHVSTVVKGAPQYDQQSWAVVPCCNSTFNTTEFLEFLHEHALDLAVWEMLGCVCPEETIKPS